jgi:hypothetical protein
MSEQPIQDLNDDKPWSEMDLFELRNSSAYGRSIEEVAGFLCRAGTVEEVKHKAEELGLLQSKLAAPSLRALRLRGKPEPEKYPVIYSSPVRWSSRLTT